MNTPSIPESVEFDRDLVALREHLSPFLEGVAKQVLALRASGTMTEESKTTESSDDAKQHDVVTEADKLSEKLIVEEIQRLFPDDSINGEEQGEQGTESSDWQWEIDPIDGTLNFRRGDQSGISLGLLHKGVPVLGLIHFFHDNSQMYASKGDGAYLYDCRLQRGVPLKVEQGSSPDDLNKAYLCWDAGYGDRHTQIANYEKIFAQTTYLTSDACYLSSTRRVLTNKRDAYVNAGGKSYDVAASAAIALEAGAVVTGIDTDTPDYLSRDVVPCIIARNQAIVDQIKAALTSDESEQPE